MVRLNDRRRIIVSGRDRLLVLSLINTVQPSLDEVRRNLPRSFDDDQLESTLRSLDRELLIERLGKNQCVVTVTGRAILGSGPLATRRDINRLLHLFKRSKEGRE